MFSTVFSSRLAERPFGYHHCEAMKTEIKYRVLKNRNEKTLMHQAIKKNSILYAKAITHVEAERQKQITKKKLKEKNGNKGTESNKNTNQ